MGKIQDNGLKIYLNSTRGLHGGLGFETFVTMITATDPRVERQEIASAFKVSRYTVYEWIKIYKAETRQEVE